MPRRTTTPTALLRSNPTTADEVRADLRVLAAAIELAAADCLEPNGWLGHMRARMVEALAPIYLRETVDGADPQVLTRMRALLRL